MGRVLAEYVRSKLFRLVVVGTVGGLVLSYVALLLPWLPGRYSKQANRTDGLIWGITYVSFIIFGIVLTVLLYSVWKYRRRDEFDERDGEPIHGNTALEVFWTAVPTLIVTGFAFWAGIVLQRNEARGSEQQPNRVVIATGYQYAWRFTYPNDGNISSDNDMTVPLGQPLEIKTASRDVIHEFYVPEWRVGMDAVPGEYNSTFSTPTRLGTYWVECAELCGPGHAGMSRIARVHIVTPDQFTAWVAKLRTAAAKQPPGQKVFSSQGCAGCHMLSKAGSKGNIGPDLDNVAQSAKSFGESTAAYVRESIINPNKHIAKGYGANIMPRNFGQQLKKQELDDLVTYIAGDAK